MTGFAGPYIHNVLSSTYTAVAQLIQDLDEFVRNKYDGQLHVEVDDNSYTIYAENHYSRICIGCGIELSEEIASIDVMQHGTIASPVLFMIQCAECNKFALAQ